MAETRIPLEPHHVKTLAALVEARTELQRRLNVALAMLGVNGPLKDFDLEGPEPYLTFVEPSDADV